MCLNKMFMSAVAVSFAVTLPLSILAIDAVSVAPGSSTGGNGVATWGWTCTDNWLDANGNALGTYPASAEYDVYLNTPSNSYSTAGLLVFDNLKDFSLGSIHGGPNFGLVFYGSSQTGAYPMQRLSIMNPDGYSGWYGDHANACYGEIALPSATAEYAPSLSHITILQRMGLKVPTGGRASVESLRGNGTLYATGGGELSIRLGPGEDGRIIATNETVEIVGRTKDDDVDSPVPGAALHLDASKRATLSTYVGADGYEHVSEWRDADGGSVIVQTNVYNGTAAHFIAHAQAPFLCAESYSPTGLRMVDFGDCVGSSRPTNCMMKLTEVIHNVREVFLAGMNTPYSGVVEPTVFGAEASSNYALEGGGVDAMFNQYASSDFRMGDVRFNGNRVPYCNMLGGSRHGSCFTNMFVASAGAVPGATVDPFLRLLGEALVYTNTLTSSQRTRINDYLMKKWLGGHDGVDFGAAVLGRSDSNTAISVPEGNVARVGNISVPNGTLVKKGGGTLSVGAISPANATVDIRGGSVKFLASQTASDSAPAADPYIWLDADDASTVITNHVTNSSNSNVNPTKWYVTRWNDCRPGVARYAEVPTEEWWPQFIYNNKNWFTTNYPTVAVNACNGHNTIYFGQLNASDAWMWLSEHGNLTSSGGNFVNAYEGFIVCKMNNARGTPYFGSSSQSLIRGSTYADRLMDPFSGYANVSSALWLFDGEVRDPWMQYSQYTDTSEYHVVSIASERKLGIDLIAKSRLYAQGNNGDISVGEFILYDRHLSPAERRQTTAYLMNKWRNEEIPEMRHSMASLAYAADIDIAIDSDNDVEIQQVTGGNGAVVKTGSGAVTVTDAEGLTGLSSITVSDGSLELGLNHTLASILDSAVFDYDAGNLSSFSNEIVTVDGVTRTNVISWADTQGRAGHIAYTAQIATDTTLVPADGSNNRTSPSTEHPTLVSAVMPDGTSRSVVDFGELGLSSRNAGAGMHMRSITTGIMEVHSVVADTDTGKRGTIVGGRKNDSGYGYAFYRDGSNHGYLFGANAMADVVNGYVAIDGETVSNPQATPLPDGFHLVSYAPLSAQKIATLAMERDTRCGGIRIGEQIAFTRTLSAAERNVLQKHLMNKWLGTPLDAVLSLDSVSVATGASLALGNVSVNAAKLSGGGTITAGEVRGISALEITGALDTITLSGTATFANDAVTVTLVDSPVSLDVGEYTVFEAGAIANENLSFSLVGTFRPKRSVKIRRIGNSIVLSVNPVGAVLTFR